MSGLDGHPTATVVLWPGYRTTVTVISSNLDGSLWVAMPNGGALCVAARQAVEDIRREGTDPTHRAWVPANHHKLTAAQVKVLTAFAAAGREGLADHEHVGTRSVETHRRVLVHRALVAEQSGQTAAGRKVWQITQAGLGALCAGCPPEFATAVD